MTPPIGKNPPSSDTFPPPASSKDAKTQAVSQTIFARVKESLYRAIQFVGVKIHVLIFHTLKLESLTLRMSAAWHQVNQEKDQLQAQNQQLLAAHQSLSAALEEMKRQNSSAFMEKSRLTRENKQHLQKLEKQKPHSDENAQLRKCVATQAARISELQEEVNGLQGALANLSRESGAQCDELGEDLLRSLEAAEGT